MFKYIVSLYKNIFGKCSKKGPFAVGDRVTAFGCFGKVTNIGRGAVDVYFPKSEMHVVFYDNGKYFLWAAKPSLKKL